MKGDKAGTNLLPLPGDFPILSPSPKETGLFLVMAPDHPENCLSTSEADFVYQVIENDTPIQPLCDFKASLSVPQA